MTVLLIKCHIRNQKKMLRRDKPPPRLTFLAQGCSQSPEALSPPPSRGHATNSVHALPLPLTPQMRRVRFVVCGVVQNVDPSRPWAGETWGLRWGRDPPAYECVLRAQVLTLKDALRVWVQRVSVRRGSPLAPQDSVRGLRVSARLQRANISYLPCTW